MMDRFRNCENVWLNTNKAAHLRAKHFQLSFDKLAFVTEFLFISANIYLR